LDKVPEIIKAKYILIATGGRPTDPGIPGGKEHSISSDDIFWMTTNPGRTLVVGASYIAL
jgi:thioredoxin reductase (NADPH)